MERLAKGASQVEQQLAGKEVVEGLKSKPGGSSSGQGQAKTVSVPSLFQQNFILILVFRIVPQSFHWLIWLFQP